MRQNENSVVLPLALAQHHTAWDNAGDEARFLVGLVWVCAGILDMILIQLVNSWWTKEVGFGGAQTLYNWLIFIALFTAVPLLVTVAYILAFAIVGALLKMVKSYNEFKRSHS